MKKIAVLVGLKEVDPKKHHGWDGEAGCWGCELDVDNVQAMLEARGWEVRTLKTKKATCKRVLKSLEKAAGESETGDYFAFYFSGHGGKINDLNGDEEDGQDETLIAYDGIIVDDELNEVWQTFAEGVKIIMISDSCNSGTNFRMFGAVDNSTPFLVGINDDGIAAEMIHIGGCRDGRTSTGYRDGGAFTKAMCNIVEDGFRGNYQKLHRLIFDKVKGTQSPQYNEYGEVSNSFRNSVVFTADSGGSEGGRQRDARPSTALHGGTGDPVSLVDQDSSPLESFGSEGPHDVFGMQLDRDRGAPRGNVEIIPVPLPIRDPSDKAVKRGGRGKRSFGARNSNATKPVDINAFGVMPNSAVGKIICEYKQCDPSSFDFVQNGMMYPGMLSGSGFVVGKRTVFTAAHVIQPVIRDRNITYRLLSAKFYPDFNPSTTTNGSFWVASECHVHSQYFDRNRNNQFLLQQQNVEITHPDGRVERFSHDVFKTVLEYDLGVFLIHKDDNEVAEHTGSFGYGFDVEDNVDCLGLGYPAKRNPSRPDLAFDGNRLWDSPGTATKSSVSDLYQKPNAMTNGCSGGVWSTAGNMAIGLNSHVNDVGTFNPMFSPLFDDDFQEMIDFVAEKGKTDNAEYL